MKNILIILILLLTSVSYSETFYEGRLLNKRHDKAKVKKFMIATDVVEWTGYKKAYAYVKCYEIIEKHEKEKYVFVITLKDKKKKLHMLHYKVPKSVYILYKRGDTVDITKEFKRIK
jgi:hypothetical protein